MRGLPSILSLFRNEFNKFNNNKSMNVRLYLLYDIEDQELKLMSTSKTQIRLRSARHLQGCV